MSQGAFIRPRLTGGPPPLDVTARLDDLRALKDGWLEGKGKAPDAGGLDWLASAFRRQFPQDLALPYLYPTPEGSVQAEWSLPPSELSMEIDLGRHTGYWHSLNVQTGHEEMREVNLDLDVDWRWLAQQIRRMAEETA